MALKNTKKGMQGAQEEQDKQEKEVSYDIKVTRAHELENCVMFDMEVNGVMIYGCNYRVLERKDGSGEFVKIGFPSKKGSDGKYYSLAYFKVTDEISADIEAQIDKLI